MRNGSRTLSFYRWGQWDSLWSHQWIGHAATWRRNQGKCVLSNPSSVFLLHHTANSVAPNLLLSDRRLGHLPLVLQVHPIPTSCPEHPGPRWLSYTTMVMPRLQMSDFTLYPFWLSSGFILSGWKGDRKRQLRGHSWLHKGSGLRVSPAAQWVAVSC